MEVAIIDLRVQYGLARRLARYTPMGSRGTRAPAAHRRRHGVLHRRHRRRDTAADKSWDKVNLNAKLAERAVEDVHEPWSRTRSSTWPTTSRTSRPTPSPRRKTSAGSSATARRPTAAWRHQQLFEANTNFKGFVVAQANHDTWPEIDNTDLTTVLGFLPTFGRVGARWVVSPLAEATMFGRLKATAGGNTNAVLRDGVVESDYLGYPVSLAEVMPSGSLTTDYSAKVMALFGNFSKGVMFGERRGITVQVLRELYAANNEIGVLSTERIDIVAHDLGDANTAGPIVALAGQ
jgi:hypothetical protein